MEHNFRISSCFGVLRKGNAGTAGYCCNTPIEQAQAPAKAEAESALSVAVKRETPDSVTPSADSLNLRPSYCCWPNLCTSGYRGSVGFRGVRFTVF